MQASRLAPIALLLLSACSTQPPLPAAVPEFKLLPPAEGPAPVLLQQTVSLLAGQREQQFLTVARFDHQRLKLVVLLPSGQRLLTLDYDGANLTQQNFAAFEIPGSEILAIMQAARWPEASLRAHYREADGWRLRISPDERQLLTEFGTALTIGYWPGELRIDNYLKEYRVIVKTLETIDL
jgi:hypothetical protein